MSPISKEWQKNAILEELERRDRIISKIMNVLGNDVTLGVAGSTANGIPKTKSDIDLFVIVNSGDIKKIIQRIYKLKTFQIPSSKVLSDFKQDKIDVLFLYGEIDKISINFEIYSIKVVKALLGLKKLIITRFRTRPTSKSLTFSNAYGNSIFVNIQTQLFAEGILTSLPGSIEHAGIVFVGNHLRKLLFGNIYRDRYNVKEMINNCFSHFIIEAKNNGKFSERCLVNLSFFDPNKRLSDNSQNYYQKLCIDLACKLELK